MHAVERYRLIDHHEAKTALARNNKENIKSSEMGSWL